MCKVVKMSTDHAAVDVKKNLTVKAVQGVNVMFRLSGSAFASAAL